MKPCWYSIAWEKGSLVLSTLPHPSPLAESTPTLKIRGDPKVEVVERWSWQHSQAPFFAVGPAPLSMQRAPQHHCSPKEFPQRASLPAKWVALRKSSWGPARARTQRLGPTQHPRTPAGLGNRRGDPVSKVHWNGFVLASPPPAVGGANSQGYLPSVKTPSSILSDR